MVAVTISLLLEDDDNNIIMKEYTTLWWAEYTHDDYNDDTINFLV